MKQKGYFLIMMFFIMIILSALAAAYSTFVIRQLKTAKILENNVVKQHIAMSGIRYAKYCLKKDVTFRKTPSPVACGTGYFSLQISSKDKHFIIESKAFLNDKDEPKNIKHIYKK
ncbi:MAG: hypothetical protein KAI43_13715 [Candidatus Aureabacteria bacterium]|nr:hypothetical protein [Candidatus Auribacterota bacterium]